MLTAVRGNKMKKLVFIATLSALITLSLMAKAENLPRTVSLQTDNVQFDPGSMIVNADGNMPTQCVVSPRPTLSKTNSDNTLLLSIVGADYSQSCMMMLGGPFKLAFDIRSLKFEIAALGLDPEATYKIITEDGSLAATVHFGSSPMNRPYATDSAVGGIFAAENGGSTVIIISDTERLVLNSPFIDVLKFIGKRVEVQGHIVKARMPNANISSDATVPPALLVTGISTTAF